MRSAATLLVLLSCGLVAGCGGSGERVKDPDRDALIRPEEAKQGYGPGAARDWPPAVEAFYQKARALPAGNHLIGVHFNLGGGYLYDAWVLAWDAAGPFRVVRASCRYDALQSPEWIEGELPRSEGEALLVKVRQAKPLELTRNERLKETVFGEGTFFFRIQAEGRSNEAMAFAPFTLADRGGPVGFQELLILLRSAGKGV